MPFGFVVAAPANAANEFYYCSRSGSSGLKAFASQSESFHCFIAFLTLAGQTRFPVTSEVLDFLSILKLAWANTFVPFLKLFFCSIQTYLA